MVEKYRLCIIIYAAAFLTDIIDGNLARRYGWITDLGKVLDPLADKLMLLAVSACFAAREWIPLYIFVIITAKELLMIVGGAVLYRKRVVVQADPIGKLATGVFAASVLCALFSKIEGLGVLTQFYPHLFVVSVIFTIAALVHYIRKQVIGRV
jgi:CDP-diacylglycerol--glycerol-3-phosphate 3-phosphatidyltransferase